MEYYFIIISVTIIISILIWRITELCLKNRAYKHREILEDKRNKHAKERHIFNQTKEEIKDEIFHELKQEIDNHIDSKIDLTLKEKIENLESQVNKNTNSSKE